MGSLLAILKEAAPADLKTLVAPYDYVPRPGFSLQPDVLVARRADLGPQKLEATPLLVVEVLSTSSRLTDRTLKRTIYEREGVPNYWLVCCRAQILHMTAAFIVPTSDVGVCRHRDGLIGMMPDSGTGEVAGGRLAGQGP